MCFQAPRYPTPTATFSGCLNENPLTGTIRTIEIDGQTVVTFKDGDITLGVSCLMACYWLFGIHYQRKGEKTLQFIEQYLCKLGGGAKVPTIVRRTHEMLSK